MLYAQVAYNRHDRCVMLAIEREGACHIVSMANHGGLCLMRSIASVFDSGFVTEPQTERIVMSASCTDREGELIVAGWKFVRKICLKLK